MLYIYIALIKPYLNIGNIVSDFLRMMSGILYCKHS